MTDSILMQNPHEGRELHSTVNGKKFSRLPIKTRMILIDEDLEKVIQEFVVPHVQEGDIVVIASKIVSICMGFYVKESELKVTWLAKFLTRFVKKWPNDPGFALPQKVQIAMNEVGMIRFLFAVVAGAFMKLIGKPGWFYRIAGHNINAIDGFIPAEYPVELHGYGFLAPKDSDGISDKLEARFGIPFAIADGNNVDVNILGRSKTIKEKFDNETFDEIMKGNPQGQDGNTPFVIIREEK